jgi:hypothetical protein
MQRGAIWSLAGDREPRLWFDAVDLGERSKRGGEPFLMGKSGQSGEAQPTGPF